MHKEKAIDYQFIRPVEVGTSAMKGKVPLRNLFKEYFRKLNVGFYDPCCSDDATCPPISAALNNAIQCNPDGLFVSISDSGGGSVTSVGLTMPAAFSVAGSPVLNTGTFIVTATGTTAQYIRGNGTLATLPVYTANNALTYTGSNLQLGGVLVQDTTINNVGFSMTFSNSTGVSSLIGTNSSTGNGLEGINTANGIGVKGSGFNGIGGSFTSTANFAVSAIATDNISIVGVGTVGAKLTAINNVALNASTTGLQVIRGVTSGTPLNNIGVSIDFQSITTTIPERLSNSIISRWTNVTDASRSSQLEIWGLNNTNLQQFLTIKGTGQHQFNRYGAGTFTGTATYALQVDAAGNIIEGGVDGFYTTDGTLTSPRTVNGGAFSLTYQNLSLFRIQNGDITIGGIYDFTTGVDLLAYNATNSSNLTLDPLSGLKFQYTTLAGPTVNTSLEVTPTGVKFTGIQEFADNAAAITGGLTTGYIYRTGDNLKIVH